MEERTSILHAWGPPLSLDTQAGFLAKASSWHRHMGAVRGV